MIAAVIAFALITTTGQPVRFCPHLRDSWGVSVLRNILYSGIEGRYGETVSRCLKLARRQYYRMRSVTPAPEVPAIRSEHVQNAALYADRTDMIARLPLPKGGVVAEVGVATGTFSKVLIETLHPRKFVAFDIFTMHELPDQQFDGLTHEQYYRRKMAAYQDILCLEEGPSHITMAKYRVDEFDLIYLDAAHRYEMVKRDAELASQMLKPNGVLIFNDYVAGNFYRRIQYGVVQAVNELIVNEGWRVIGYALSANMHCDIALQRRVHSR